MDNDRTAPDASGAAIVNFDALVNDLSPVRPLQLRHGMVLSISAAIAACAAVALLLGIRGDVANGVPHPMFLARATALVALGLTGALAALSAGLPGIGGRSSTAWRWALAAAIVFPLGALITWLIAPVETMNNAEALLDPQYGLECLRISALCGAGIASVMVLWLRRGAPTSPERAGWLVGLAAGGLGAAAYGICCSENTFIYIGTWYTLAVGLCAVAGRLVVTPLLRW